MKFIKHLYRWVIKVAQYSVVLWDDYDFDYGSILKLLLYKIKRTREHIAKHANHSDYKESVAQMQAAEDSIKLILADDWLSEETEAHHKKYPIRFVDRISQPDEEGSANWRSLSARMQVLEEAEWTALCENLRKNMRGWWD